LVQGEAAEAWIKKLVKFQDGRKDLKALTSHFAGEGNSTRRLAEAERMYVNLHYKGERALPFATFLDQMIKMFNIFFDEDEAMSEGSKVRFLFKKISNPGLTATVAALTVEHNIKGITFVSAANHIASAVSVLPEYQQQSRKVSQVQSHSGRGGGRGFHRGGRGSGRGGGRGFGRGSGRGYGRGGGGPANHTDYHSKEAWDKLSFDQRDKIREERDKKGTQGGKKRDISQVSSGVSEETLLRIVKAVRTDFQEAYVSAQTDINTNVNAGNSFGGKQSARK
jgi:hypothetical protein